jgi:hypothetical protein
MEEKTIANLQRLKSRIRAQLPNFVIGTNFGSWMETHSYPKMTAELARDGGWLLDEVCYGYNRPQSPYHFWDAYYAIMADEGEHVTSLGGHYHPFAFNRNGGKYPVDGLYETIFRLAGRGHPQSAFYNSQLPAGNFGQFAVRFGRFLFDPAIRRLEPAEPTVRVTSAAPLWWQKTVAVLREPAAEYLLVHLINPPVAKEAETDPMSRLNAPVTDVQLSVAVPAGRTKATAWVLTAEAWEPGAAPQVRAVPVDVAVADGRVAVRVPAVLFWKLLALRFE